MLAVNEVDYTTVCCVIGGACRHGYAVQGRGVFWGTPSMTVSGFVTSTDHALCTHVEVHLYIVSNVRAVRRGMSIHYVCM